MMYSVCIPIYNQDPFELVKELSAQAEMHSEDIEILVLDDGSPKSVKAIEEKINELPFASFKVLDKNVGRSVIRNRLAEMAQGEYIIFLDGDSLVNKKDFLASYTMAMDYDVLVGGRIYPETVSKEHKLHWTYGINKESKKANLRSLDSYSNFHSNNFLIKKEQFLKIQFEEKLQTYGHEDTLFGFELELNKYKVGHIDNEVLHGTLESNTSFISKTELGIRNLLLIHKLKPGFETKSPLLATYLKLRSFGLDKVVAIKFKIFRKTLMKNLSGTKPSMKIFDFYKLGYLCSIA